MLKFWGKMGFKAYSHIFTEFLQLAYPFDCKVMNKASEMAFPEISVCLLKTTPSLAFIIYFPGLKTALEYQMALAKMDQYGPSLPGCFGGGATMLIELLQQPDLKSSALGINENSTLKSIELADWHVDEVKDLKDTFKLQEVNEHPADYESENVRIII
ncbi:hypothetical protein HGM15179_011120 [Zosterops borbonicus]|uniref:Uncharacterized protein n=1 Tax=Zosterops borbonicus TaxID=364589 RepID=A0A8K1LJC3_9PASS|nr:hypothetical protein HGM15179_011120 [Zosterops borbonicus]